MTILLLSLFELFVLTGKDEKKKQDENQKDENDGWLCQKILDTIQNESKQYWIVIFSSKLSLRIKGLVLLGSIVCKTDSKIRPPKTFRGNGGQARLYSVKDSFYFGNYKK